MAAQDCDLPDIVKCVMGVEAKLADSEVGSLTNTQIMNCENNTGSGDDGKNDANGAKNDQGGNKTYLIGTLVMIALLLMSMSIGAFLLVRVVILGKFFYEISVIEKKCPPPY